MKRKHKIFRKYIHPAIWWKRCIRKRDGDKCTICGASKTKLPIHHIIPKSKGGLSTKENLTTLCNSCHNTIHQVKEEKGANKCAE
jgi:5-methylcytosine-specific restriction endonuclease McrA